MARQGYYSLRISDLERERWKNHANRLGIPIAEWVRMACNKEIDRVDRTSDSRTVRDSD